MAKPIIICAQQRSGTTALQSYLSHVDGVRGLGEIFMTTDFAIKQPQSFYYYVKNRLDGKFVLLSDADAEKHLELYLEYLSSLCPGTYYVIDIKYDFWHHFSPGWFNLMDAAFMLRYFKSQNFPIIHVVRENPFQQYVSHIYALATNRWHYRPEASKPDSPSIAIDCRQMAAFLKRVEGNIHHFRECLNCYSNTVELAYETLFDGTSLRPETQQSLLKVLPGWVVKHGKSEFIKPKIDTLSCITNKEEIIQFFYKTKYGTMIMDALRPPLEQADPLRLPELE